MIELIIKQRLDEKISVPVYLESPREKPTSYILFEKVGGTGKFGLKSSTIAFQSYDESLYKAALLNESLKLEVDDLIHLDEIVSVTLNSDYNFTDSETKQYRYQAVYDIKHY